MDLDPDIPLTDKDDQEEEPSQNVAGIQNPEGYLDILAGLTGLIVMVVDKEMNSLNGPQNAKDQEQFHVKDLKYRVINVQNSDKPHLQHHPHSKYTSLTNLTKEWKPAARLSHTFEYFLDLACKVKPEPA